MKEGSSVGRVNVFGMFVKENFADVKRENPGVAHKEIMGILSKMYREGKANGGKGNGGAEGVGKGRKIIEVEDNEVGEIRKTLEEMVL